MFDDLALYNECFIVLKAEKYVVVNQLGLQKWLDGAGRLSKLRSCSVDKAINFLNSKRACNNEIAVCLYDSVFVHIKQSVPDFVKRFIFQTNATEVVSVISAVKPWDVTKFFTHLCLSLGSYETEYDLFRSGSILIRCTPKKPRRLPN